MEENFFATYSANSKWRKTFPRRTLQIQNGGKLFRGVLCKFKMEENFFAVDSANSKWRKIFSRWTLQIQNGRNTAKMAAHRADDARKVPERLSFQLPTSLAAWKPSMISVKRAGGKPTKKW
jgi:hypothetical protein